MNHILKGNQELVRAQCAKSVQNGGEMWELS